MAKPAAERIAAWSAAGVAEPLWGLPDAPAGAIEAYLDRLASRLGI